MAELSAVIRANSNSINNLRTQISSNYNNNLKSRYNRLKSSKSLIVQSLNINLLVSRNISITNLKINYSHYTRLTLLM